MEGSLIRQALNFKMNERQIPNNNIGEMDNWRNWYTHGTQNAARKDKSSNLLLSTILRPLQRKLFLKELLVKPCVGGSNPSSGYIAGVA